MKRKFRGVICGGAMLILTVCFLNSGTAQENAGDPSMQGIKEALKHKDETNTLVLIEKLKSLLNEKANQLFICGNGLPSDPLLHPHILFDTILDELISRDGKPVLQLMQNLLLNENLNEDDKRKIWQALERKSGSAFPVILEATDHSQTRQYLLQIETNIKSEVEVKKGDTMLRIAKKTYPDLGMWSGADIISFMNGFHWYDPIMVGDKFKIYSYKIVKEIPLAGLESSSTKKGP
jgi:hypothetical protein